MTQLFNWEGFSKAETVFVKTKVYLIRKYIYRLKWHYNFTVNVNKHVWKEEFLSDQVPNPHEFTMVSEVLPVLAVCIICTYYLGNMFHFLHNLDCKSISMILWYCYTLHQCDSHLGEWYIRLHLWQKF